MDLNDLTILIIGYDPYKDVWDIFFKLYEKNWKNHPKTILSTNTLTPCYPNVKVISNGIEAEWSLKVINACNEIDTKYVCLLLEDFFIGDLIDNNIIIDRLNIMADNNIKYLKLLDQRKNKKDSYKDNTYINIIMKNLEYGISLQPAIWDKTFLLELIGEKNYNAWVFELLQAKNPIQNISQIDCLEDISNPLNIIHGIVQQEYLPKSVKKLKKIGIDVRGGVRPVMNKSKYFKYKLKLLTSYNSPRFLKKPLKFIGRKIGVDFVSDRELGGIE